MYASPSAPARRTLTAPFRVASRGSAPVWTTGELEEQLRRRLRWIALLDGLALLAKTAIDVSLDGAAYLRHPAALFVTPPLDGWIGLTAAVSLALVGLLSPRRRLGLRGLRVVEILVIAPLVLLFVMIFTMDLHGMARDGLLATAPADLAGGAAIPWIFLLVIYGVLIPNRWRRSATAVAAIVACAFVPDVLALPGSGLSAATVASFVSMQAIWLGAAAAIAVYGAYRIETLREDAAEARRLGQYVLGQRLGGGGMGEVYLAEHRFLRRPCAVKLIRPDHAGDAGTLARFEREVQATAALTHPNTVQIYDYGHADDGTFYYAMEYLPGVSLEELVERDGPLPWPRAVRFLVQICGALREAHGLGLLHRDIKPSNVMICERGGVPDVAKLLDFGLVAPLHPTPRGAHEAKLTEAGMILGTPAYMSPEQCGGADDLTPASDVYGVGTLAYFLLTGAPPFAGRGPVQTLVAHMSEPPLPPRERRPDVPEEVDAIVMRCLAKEPAARYASAAELEAALAYLETAPSPRLSAVSYGL